MDHHTRIVTKRANWYRSDGGIFEVVIYDDGTYELNPDPADIPLTPVEEEEMEAMLDSFRTGQQ